MSDDRETEEALRETTKLLEECRQIIQHMNKSITDLIAFTEGFKRGLTEEKPEPKKDPNVFRVSMDSFGISVNPPINTKDKK